MREMDRLEPMTILIVEDQSLISLQLVYILQSWAPSASIVIAANGQEGLLQAREVRPDLIITDLAMPKMDGYELVKTLRQEQAGSSISIIGISASDPADVKASAFRRLCDDIIDKPFSPQEVLYKIAKLLRTKTIK